MGRRGPARDDKPRIAVATILVAGGAVSLWLNWPGHFSYDSVVQLAEGRTGSYTGQHPLVMSWLLSLADRVAAGAAPFVVLDTALIFGALLSLVLIARRVSWLAAAMAVVCVILPQLLVYPAIVWKDVLFAGAAIAGFASLAWAAASWARVRVRYALLAAALVLLTLAALSRQNGPVVLPLAAIAVGWTGAMSSKGAKLRAVALGAGFLTAGLALAAAVSAALSLRLETPGAMQQAWTALQTYDIVAAVARDPGMDLAALKARAPALDTMIRTQGVAAYSPSRVDTLEPMLERMDASASAPIAAQWFQLILRHPLLYLRVRARSEEHTSE